MRRAGRGRGAVERGGGGQAARAARRRRARQRRQRREQRAQQRVAGQRLLRGVGHAVLQILVLRHFAFCGC